MRRKLLEKRAWDFAQNLVGQLIALLGTMRIDVVLGAVLWHQAVADPAWNLRPFQYQLPYPFGVTAAHCAQGALDLQRVVAMHPKAGWLLWSG